MSPKKKKPKRLPKGEQIQAASLISGRASFPVRGDADANSECMKIVFHRVTILTQRMITATCPVCLTGH